MNSRISRFRMSSWLADFVLADMTNLPTVISHFSAISSCSSRNSQICLTRGGAFSLIFSVTLSNLVVRNGHLPLSNGLSRDDHPLPTGLISTAGKDPTSQDKGPRPTQSRCARAQKSPSDLGHIHPCCCHLRLQKPLNYRL